MQNIYTHIWRNLEDNHFASEGHCAKTQRQAIDILEDYSYAWHRDNYVYHTTYVENLSDKSLHSVNLSKYLDKDEE